MSGEKKQCSVRIIITQHPWGEQQCKRLVTAERDGKLYCTIHDPERIAQKWAERQAKWESNWEVDNKRWAWESARNAAVAGLTTEELRQVTPQMIRDAINSKHVMDAADARRINRCTPGCPSAPMQADVQDGDSFVKGISTGVAGDLDRQPATNMNWEEVRKCNIWRELGVSECDGCPGNSKCWTASPPNKEVRTND